MENQQNPQITMSSGDDNSKKVQLQPQQANIPTTVKTPLQTNLPQPSNIKLDSQIQQDSGNTSQVIHNHQEIHNNPTIGQTSQATATNISMVNNNNNNNNIYYNTDNQQQQQGGQQSSSNNDNNSTNISQQNVNLSIQQQQQIPSIQPLLAPDNNILDQNSNNNINANNQATTINLPTTDQGSPQKSMITRVKLSDELNIFDWFRTTDIINQIAEKAKHSVDTVITALDPGMKEYLYSGGNINIMVISDSDNIVSPIRDSFQSAFGRATVTAARYNPPEAALDYPIRLASGFNEAILVAQERIKRLRSDTNGVPQNQVIVAVQSCIVNLFNDESTTTTINLNGLKLGENFQPKWYLTYCMIIEDPVLLVTMSSFSQFIPIDDNIVSSAKDSKYPDNFQDKHLGYTLSIEQIMNYKLRLMPKESSDLEDSQWLKDWSGISEGQMIRDLSNSLAHLYKRKWDECINLNQ